MASVEWIARLFHSIDTNDTHTFASFLTPDALFKFANQEPAVGKEAARQTVAEFLLSIKAIHHDVLDIWEKEGATACHGIVTAPRLQSTPRLICQRVQNAGKFDSRISDLRRCVTTLCPRRTLVFLNAG